MHPARSAFFAVLAIAVLLPAASASALSYPVTSTADGITPGTLHWAINEADAHMGPDSIPIEVTGTITLVEKLGAITDDVTITGPGAASLTLTRSAASPPFRVFEFSNVEATLSGITVRGGLATTGAGILNAAGNLTLVRVGVVGNEARNAGGGTRIAGGGGILNTGTLSLRESIVRENLVVAAGGEESFAGGGGIESEGALFVERSTIAENLVEARGEGEPRAGAVGGGLALTVSGNTTVEESTISGNFVFAADATDLAVARGGGIQGGTVSLTGSTVAENGAELDAAGVTASNVAGDNLAVSITSSARDTLVADARGEGENCAGALVSAGFNLDQDGTCDFGQGSDLNGVAAGLDPVLRDNGGPSPTHALLSGSIAIDRGSSFGATTDQRGLPRPSDFPAISNKEGGDGSDIGAFELQVPPDASRPPAPILVGAEPADTTPPRTRIISGPARVGYRRLATFRFTSNEAQSTFRCRVDRKPWRKCISPFRVRVEPGKHHFRVRAIDRFGNVDRRAARFSWRVKPLS
jgi:hypothetical protein